MFIHLPAELLSFMKPSRPLSRSLALLGLSAIALVPSVRAANLTWDGEAGTNWSNGVNWLGDLAPAPGDALIFTGALGTAASNNYAPNTTFAGLTFDASAAAFTLGGSAINLSGGVVNNSLSVETISLSVGLQGTQTVNVSSVDGVLTISGILSGAGAGLTKTGNGLLTLSGANTFTGPVTISGGTLAFSADSATTGAPNQLGATPGVATAGAIVIDGGTLRNTAATQLATVRGIALGNASGGGGTIDVNGGALTYNGVMANNGGTNSFTKTGVNQLTLGGVNTYTGNTILNQGTLKLDFTQLAGTTSNIINSSSMLVMGGLSTALGNANAQLTGTMQPGATLNMTSKSAANSTQTFNGLVLNPGYASINTTQTASGNNLLTLGAITHNPGGIVNFNLAGTLSANNAIVTTNGNTNGILGGWAAYNGTAYAANNGAGSIVAYTGYTDVTASGAAIADGFTTNVRLNSGAAGTNTLGGTPTTVNVNTLSQNTAVVSTLNMAAGDVLRLGVNGGVMVTSAAGTTGALVIGQAGTQGRLMAGGNTDGVAGEITFLDYNTATTGTGLTVNAIIANNNTLTGAGNSTGGGDVSVSIFGNQGLGGNTIILSGANTYSGGTRVVQGRIQVTNLSAFGTGPVTILSGAQAWLNAGNGTYPNNFNLAGSGYATQFDTPSALRVTASNTTLAGTITLLNDATIDIRNTSTHNITGPITGNYNFTITGVSVTGGVIALSNTANNWGGNFFIDQITTRLGNNEVLPNGAGKGNVVLTNNAASILDLNGKNETINGLSSLGTVPFVQNNAASTTSTLTLGDGNATATYTGIIRNNSGTGGFVALTKIGAGAQTLSGANTFTGPISVQAGTLALTGANATTDVVTISGGTLFLNGNGTVNSSSGIVINGSNARLLDNATTFIQPPVTLTQGTVQGSGGTLNTLDVADLAANSIIAGLGGTGTLSIGALTFSGAASIVVANTAQLSTGILTANGTAGSIKVNSSGAWTTGSSYDLITYGSVIGGTGGSAAFTKGTVSGLGARQTATLVDTGFALSLSIGGDTAVWTGAASGVWSQSAIPSPFNWKLQVALTGTQFLNNDSVIFADTIPGGGAPGTTNITINDATVTPASMLFDNTALNYTLSGSNGILTGSLIKKGTGLLTILTPNSFSGLTQINGGIVNYQNGTAFGSSAITVAAGATVQVQGDIAGGAAGLSLNGAGAPGQNGALVNVSGTNSFAGTITLTDSTTISVDSGTLNLTGVGAVTGTSFGLTLAGPGDGSLAGVIATGSLGTLVKNGAGTWILAAQTTQNNYTGGTTVNAGLLKATNASGGITAITTTVLGTGPATIAAGATLWLDYELGNGGADTTYPNAFSGAGLLKVTAPATGGTNFSTAILSGDLSGFTGTIDLFPNSGNIGKTRISSAVTGQQPAASALIKIENGTSLYISNTQTYANSFELYGTGNSELLGTLRLEGGATVSGAVTLKANATLGNGPATISGVIGESGGSFGFEKRGTAALTISGANTYSGGTTISVGTLSVGHNSALGSGPVTMNGGALAASVGGVTIANPITDNVASTFNTANSYTISGNITGGVAATQTITGPGTLTLGGTDTWAFATASAGLVVNGGASVNLAGSINLSGSVPNSGYLTIGSTAGLNSTFIVAAGGSLSILGTTDPTKSASIVGQNAATNSTLIVTGGTVTFGPNAGLMLGNNMAAATGTLTVNAGLVTINKGTTSNNFGASALTDTTVVMVGRDGATGNINLNGGTLATDRQFVTDGSSNAGAGTGNFVFNGGTLKALGDVPDWLRSTPTTNFLPLTSVIVQAGGAVVDTNGFSASINNVLADGGGGGLTKNGNGILTLGGISTYTGATTVNAGSLLVNGNISGSVATVLSGATLGGTGFVGSVTVNSGAALQGGDGTAAGGALSSGGAVILGDGSVIKLTLGVGGAHSSLIDTGGAWSFDLDQAFAVNAEAAAGTYDNVISGLTGAEPGLATISTWKITTVGLTGTFSYDLAGGVDLVLVPEPGTTVLLLGGLACLARRRPSREGK